MLRDRSLVPLSHQHHNALGRCVLTERSLDSDRSPENLHRLARRIIDRYEIELANHFALEEEVLFPPLREAGVDGLVGQLVGEHRQLEAHVEAIRHGAAAETIEEFSSLLRRHVRREENELFEEAQRRLPREVLDRVGAELEARVVRVCL